MLWPFFFSSRRRHTRWTGDWSSDVCSSDLSAAGASAAERIEPVLGDLRRPLLGVEQERVAELQGKIDHFFHLAAVYDMTAPAQRNTAVNVGGTTHAVELARALDAKTLHHVSSIAVAGEYRGLFEEDMFDEGQRLP